MASKAANEREAMKIALQLQFDADMKAQQAAQRATPIMTGSSDEQPLFLIILAVVVVLIFVILSLICFTRWWFRQPRKRKSKECAAFPAQDVATVVDQSTAVHPAPMVHRTQSGVHGELQNRVLSRFSHPQSQ